MLLRIDHETKLTYTEPVIESVMEIRMTPPSNEDQTVLGSKTRLTPSAQLTAYRDGFGNRAELFNVLTPHREVTIRASSCVRVHRRPFERMQGVQIKDHSGALESIEFLRPSPLTEPTAEVRQFVANLPKSPNTMRELAETLVEAVRSQLKYEKKVTDSSTPVGEVLRLGQGVCQDFAHLFIASCRLLGVASRYVSGYINQPGEIATHAWCQIFAGSGIGWVDIDPTQGKWVENHHVATAMGRDYGDVPPNRGVWKGGDVQESIAVAVAVREVDSVPADLTELTSPAWSQSQSQSQEGPRQANRNGLSNQSRRQSYRQQQSQQQQ